MHAQRGQAAVELVAVLPLLAALLAGLWQAALVGEAAWSAASAARAAARAAAVGGSAAARRPRPPPGSARARAEGRRRRSRPGAGHGPRAVAVRAPPRRHVLDGRVRAAAMRRASGQSTVEVIGLLPLLLAVGLGVFALLSAGSAREAASGAAEAGAVALLQGRDARAAARDALGRWPRDRTRVVGGRPPRHRARDAERAVRRPPPRDRDGRRGRGARRAVRRRARGRRRPTRRTARSRSPGGGP